MTDEFQLMLHLHAVADLKDVLTAWRTVFLHVGVICRHASREQWYFSRGCVRSGALLWPATRTPCGKGVVWAFKKLPDASELWWVPVLSFSEW